MDNHGMRSSQSQTNIGLIAWGQEEANDNESNQRPTHYSNYMIIAITALAVMGTAYCIFNKCRKQKKKRWLAKTAKLEAVLTGAMGNDSPQYLPLEYHPPQVQQAMPVTMRNPNILPLTYIPSPPPSAPPRYSQAELTSSAGERALVPTQQITQQPIQRNVIKSVAEQASF